MSRTFDATPVALAGQRCDPHGYPARPMSDRHDLQRFVLAQERTYDSALRELRAGQKTSHWMWFVFPQIAGLGRSHTAQQYAVASLEEARAYLAHPVLGSRLV